MFMLRRRDRKFLILSLLKKYTWSYLVLPDHLNGGIKSGYLTMKMEAMQWCLAIVYDMTILTSHKRHASIWAYDMG